jgi:endoglucanase
MFRISTSLRFGFAIALAACAGPTPDTPGDGAHGSGSDNGGDGGTGSGTVDGGGGSGSGTIGQGLHAVGGKIYDGSGELVRITGVNWFGLETPDYKPHGLWMRTLDQLLDSIQTAGFNAIRLPYCNTALTTSASSALDTNLNPDLVGKTGLQIMDLVIAGASARGIKVILDRHTLHGEPNTDVTLWYDSQVSEQQWIDDWVMLAQRYKGNPTVIGFDLQNEPHGTARWGNGDPATDWQIAAQKAGNAVLAANPDLLIIVEGVEQFNNQFYWWGGQLMGAATYPVQLSIPDKLVYSPHDYPSSIFAQTWFSDPTYPANLPGVWDANWGYLSKANTAPILIGEFGSMLQTTSDQQWIDALAQYITTNGLSFTYWALNPDSGDTGGILEGDWTTIDPVKLAALTPILAPLLPANN